MPELEEVAKGKTKTIFAGEDDPHFVLIESGSDVTAGDGKHRDELDGKAVAATTTTCNMFELLEQYGIDTHFVERVSDNQFQALRAQMIPIELVVRRLATGSYLERNPDVEEGTYFEKLIFEMFWKEDEGEHTDPYILLDEIEQQLQLYSAHAPIVGYPIGIIPVSDDRTKLGLKDGNSLGALRALKQTTLQVFRTVESAFRKEGIWLVDLKIDCGWVYDPEEGLRLVVADVVDNDSWRIWPGGDKSKMLDKQRYREIVDSDDPKAKAKEMSQLKKDYAMVAELTTGFVQTD